MEKGVIRRIYLLICSSIDFSNRQNLFKNSLFLQSTSRLTQTRPCLSSLSLLYLLCPKSTFFSNRQNLFKNSLFLQSTSRLTQTRPSPYIANTYKTHRNSPLFFR